MRELLDAGQHLPRLRTELDLQVLYTDLDGTLFGPGGSLFGGSDTGTTLQASIALATLHERGIEIVPVSGRTADQVRETSRILGATDFIAEAGTVRSENSELILEAGGWPGDGSPFEAMARTGAAGLLLDTYAGRLEPHAPWAFAGRLGTMLFRGRVDTVEAGTLLARAGYRWLDLLDNGALHGTFPQLETKDVHAYHLTLRGVNKASGIAADMGRRGLQARHAVVIGDAPADAAAAAHVGAVFIVANGRAAVEAAGEPAPNVYATTRKRGDGFAEAVLGLLGPTG